MKMLGTLAAAILFATSTSLAAQDPIVAEKPAQRKSTELQWLPVEELVADAGVAEVAVESPPPAVAASETYRYVLVRGIVPLAKLHHELERAVPGRATEPTLDLLDFQMERQATGSDAAKNPAWKLFNLQQTADVLDRVRGFEADSVDPDARSAVITAPLPERVNGIWQNASHPRLNGESDGDLLLFRCPDFDVQPRTRYRYRVRLKFLNPNHGLDGAEIAHPDVTAAQYRWTDWSKPSAWVEVQADIE